METQSYINKMDCYYKLKNHKLLQSTLKTKKISSIRSVNIEAIKTQRIENSRSNAKRIQYLGIIMFQKAGSRV